MMSTYARLVPIMAPPEEREAIINDVASAHNDLRDQGVDVVADVECTPDGDRWVIYWDSDDARAVA